MKFNSVLLLFLSYCITISTIQYFPNKVWLFWDKGYDSLGQMGKLCVKRMVQINKDWDVRLVSDASLNQQFSQDQLKQFNQISQYTGVKMTPYLRSYFVRLMLLKKYGGVYIDVLSIMLENLGWLYKLDLNAEVMNNLGTSPQAFFFYEANDPALGRLNIVHQDNKDYYPTIEIDTMLLAAMKDSVYISDLYNQLKILHEKGKDYYTKVSNQLFLFRQFKQTETIHLAHHIIQHRQYRQYQATKKQKLPFSVYNFYKIWTINRMKGPYSYFKQRNIQVLFKDVNHLIYQPKYLIKLQANKRDSQLNKFLRNDSFQKDMAMRQYDQYLFDFGQYYLPNTFSCLYKSYIDEDSIINQHLIQNFNNQKQFSIQTLQVKKNSQIPWICKKTTIYNLNDHFKQVWNFLYIPFYLIVFIQFLIEITLGLKRYNIELREKNLNQSNKQHVKEKIYILGLLGFVVYLQLCFMYEQIFMWYYGSPSSMMIWLINLVVISFVLSYFNIVNRKIFGKVIDMKKFVFLVIGALFLQEMIVQTLSVWNYKGFLFHFQKLSRMNLANNNEIFWGFLKIVVMFIISEIYFGIKKYHNSNRDKIYSKINHLVNEGRRYARQAYNKAIQKINNNKREMNSESLPQQSKTLTELPSAKQ